MFFITLVLSEEQAKGIKQIKPSKTIIAVIIPNVTTSILSAKLKFHWRPCLVYGVLPSLAPDWVAIFSGSSHDNKTMIVWPDFINRLISLRYMYNLWRTDCESICDLTNAFGKRNIHFYNGRGKIRHQPLAAVTPSTYDRRTSQHDLDFSSQRPCAMMPDRFFVDFGCSFIHWAHRLGLIHRQWNV